MKLNTHHALDTRHMTWLPKTKQLIVEASSIGLTPGRLYDDAADYGIWVKSHRTGNLEPFSYDGPDFDQEAEVISWKFTNHKHGITLIVYND